MLFKRFIWITFFAGLFGVTLAQIIAATHPNRYEPMLEERLNRFHKVEQLEPLCMQADNCAETT